MTPAIAQWDRCRPWIEAALALVETHTIDDIARGVEEGRFHFWPGERAAAITCVNVFPRAQYLNVFLAGGDMEELLAMVPSFKSWGRHLGCSKLTLFGRAGWKRVLRDWQQEVVVLSTSLELGANEEHADDRKNHSKN